MFYRAAHEQPAGRIAVQVVSILVLALSCAAQVEVEPSAVVQWGREHARPIEPSGSASLADLAPLATLVGNAPVIGLGEAGHGFHEFLTFRNRLVQFAVETLGVTAIAAETGFTESQAADDYVLGRGEFSPAVATAVFSWSTAAYDENRALLDWMRSYNARRGAERKVRFYGIDLTGGRAGRFVEARRSLDAALDYAVALESGQAPPIRARIEPIKAQFASGEYDKLTAEAAVTTHCWIAEPNARSNASFDVKAGHAADFRWKRLTRSSIVAQQLNANFRSAAAESNPQAQRESAMAQNLIRVLQQEGAQGRVLLYEANWHISKGPMSADRFGSSLGEHLRAVLGREYVAIALSFGEQRETSGAKADSSDHPDPVSTAALLSNVCPTSCWVNFRDVPVRGGTPDSGRTHR